METKQIELTEALCDIVKLLYDNGPMTYEELAEALGKDKSTVVRQCQKLMEMEIAERTRKDGRTACKLVEDIQFNEDECIVEVEEVAEDPLEKLRSVLEEAGVKGKRLKFIMSVIEANPQALQDPYALFDILVSAGVRRNLAALIVKSVFGVSIPVHPYLGPMGAPSGSWAAPRYGMYNMYMMPYPPINTDNVTREIARLEAKLERLAEKLAEARNGSSSDPQTMTQVIASVMQVASKDKDMLWQAIMKQNETLHQVISEVSKSLEALSEKQRELLRELTERFEKLLERKDEEYRREMEKLREEILKSREEIYKEREQFLQQQLNELQQALQSIPERIRSEIEKEYRFRLELLQKEIEWREKLREAEERRTLKDLVVKKLDEATTEIKKFTDTFKEYIEAQLKQRLAARLAEHETVSEEEKDEIVRRLRERLGLGAERTSVEGSGGTGSQDLVVGGGGGARQESSGENREVDVRLRVVAPEGEGCKVCRG